MTGDAHDSLDLGRFPDAFAPLLEKREALNHAKIWWRLDPEERCGSLAVFIRRPRNRNRLEKAVALARKTRLVTVRNKWDDEMLVRIAAQVPLGGRLVRDVMRTLHDVHRSELVASFLDSLGLGREGKVRLRQEAKAAEPQTERDLTEADVHEAASACARQQGLPRSVLFLLLLAADRVPYGEHIWSWMERVRAGRVGPARQPSPSGHTDESGQDKLTAAVDEAEASTPDLSRGVNDSLAAPSLDATSDVDSPSDGQKGERDVTSGTPQSPEKRPDARVGTESALAGLAPESAAATAARPPAPDERESADHARSDGEATVIAKRAFLPGPGLNDLDNLLILALVGTLQKVLGSLTHDQISAAVDELVHLNSSRHQSYFHSGFRDVLFDRPVVRERPEDNDYRRRWRWAGAICGWARRGEWDRIVEEYNGNSVVRRLGDGKSRATDEAALHIVDALWRRGSDEKIEAIAEFLAPASLRSPSSAPLIEKVVQIGTELLRADRIPEADAMFGLVLRVAPELEDSGRGEQSEIFLTARRRRAHCLQRLDQRDRARLLLEELVTLENDPNRLAEDYADLGLIEGGFRELADVSLPLRRRDLADFLDRLREGRRNYRRSAGDHPLPGRESAVTEGAPFSAHGHYCLGVLALGEAVSARGEHQEEHYRNAKRHLLSARNRFAARPASYGGSLVNRAALYLGVARVGDPEPTDLAHATRLMREALREGALLPPYLVDDILEVLEVLGARDDLSSFASALIAHHDDDALDELSDNEAVMRDCPDVRDRLRERALRAGPSEAAARDFQACLAGYLKAGALDEALEVLGQLESLAVRRIGTREFAKLLRDRRYEPAWEPEEAEIARARCLEAEGSFVDALGVLRSLVFRLAAGNKLLEAEGFLERIRGYGLPVDSYGDLEGRVSALRLQQEEQESAATESRTPNRTPVRILFVGGDERQERVEDRVRAELGRRDPDVRITFVYTGWSPNWNRSLGKVRRHLRSHDALVLMRFVPTLLGREIRKACGTKQWRPCCHAGPRVMVTSILAAAAAARGM